MDMFIALPVLKSILMKRVRWSFIQTCLGNFHRFTSVKVNFFINRVKFYPDLSLEISIKLPVFKGHAVLINRVKFYPAIRLWKVPSIYQYLKLSFNK